MGFGLPLMLLGLAGITIPVVIHLLNRRRFDVVDWAAMQFLQVSEATRRRLLLEEILLLLLRMGLIAALVFALAAPYTTSQLFAGPGARDNRDVVLVFDGSYSMGYEGTGRTPHDAAKEWAAAFMREMVAGDRAAVLLARQQPVVLQELTHDLARVRERVAEMPSSRGGCDWPQAIQAAWKLLDDSHRPREVVILTDGQRYGWADEATLRRWKPLAEQQKNAAPVRVVNLDPDRPAKVPNWSLAPLRAGRAVAAAGQLVTFQTALQLAGQDDYRPPHCLRLEIDGKPAPDLKAPVSVKLEKGQVPLSFSHRFAEPGSHLVSVIVEPDPPAEQRAANYRIKDQLPGDNRQDFAVEVVPALPVLLVDGDTRLSPRRRGTDFLRDALSPARDRTPSVHARVIPVQDFGPASLTTDIKEPGTKPRVLVLSDVARLESVQQEAVAQFLANGGGVLVTLGERADADAYNKSLYRGGHGWLPARLDEPTGSEAEPDRAASPLPTSFFHPALEIFRDAAAGGLGDARFPRWWKLTTPGRGTAAVPVALLTSNDPLFVEKPYQAGRVLLSAVPLDGSWRTNLTDLPAFAPLAHELIFYLAGARSADSNVQPGQPLRFRPPGDPAPSMVKLHRPDGGFQTLTPERWPLVIEDTREPGVYRAETASGPPAYFVVQPDPRESDLTPCSDADRQQVARLVPVTYQDGRERRTAEVAETTEPREMWGWFLAAVIGLLGAEVALTRRLALNRH